jgi:hypothetical protein
MDAIVSVSCSFHSKLWHAINGDHYPQANIGKCDNITFRKNIRDFKIFCLSSNPHTFRQGSEVVKGPPVAGPLLPMFLRICLRQGWSHQL